MIADEALRILSLCMAALFASAIAHGPEAEDEYLRREVNAVAKSLAAAD